MKKNKEICEVSALSDNQLLLISGGSGTISGIAKGVFEGVSVAVLSSAIIAEGIKLMGDISLSDKDWERKKARHDTNSFIQNCKCIGGPLKATSGLYYKAHNGVVDVARTPLSDLRRKKLK